jgi:hypothetical protein
LLSTVSGGVSTLRIAATAAIRLSASCITAGIGKGSVLIGFGVAVNIDGLLALLPSS